MSCPLTNLLLHGETYVMSAIGEGKLSTGTCIGTALQAKYLIKELGKGSAKINSIGDFYFTLFAIESCICRKGRCCQPALIISGIGANGLG